MSTDVTTIKVKPWAMIEIKDQRDHAYLCAMAKAYEAAYDDPSSNKDYIKIKNAMTKALDQMQKEVEKLERKEAGRGSYNDMDDEAKMNFVCTMLNGEYRKGFARDGTLQMLKVMDAARRIVEIVDSRQAIDDQIKMRIAQKLVERKQILAPRHIAELADFWRHYGEAIPSSFITYAGFDPEPWALGRSNHLPVKGALPTWNNLMKRMNDPRAFAAWVYGVASKRYRGRQILWLHGDNGEDGKSFIQKIIVEEVFGKVNKAMTNNALGEGAARFMQADFEGKALAFWDDCNNQMALMREDIKQLSSGLEGNLTRIEKKGKQSYDAQLETRMWINSNFAPTVPADNFIRSRLLYIHISPLEEEKDVTLKAKFIAELPALLHFGKECFEELCRGEREIAQNFEANEAIDNLVADFETEFESIFQTYFKVLPKGRNIPPLRTSEVQPVLKKAGLITNLKQGQWYTWAKQRHGLKKTSMIGTDGKKYPVIEGFSLKGGF